MADRPFRSTSHRRFKVVPAGRPPSPLADRIFLNIQVEREYGLRDILPFPECSDLPRSETVNRGQAGFVETTHSLLVDQATVTQIGRRLALSKAVDKTTISRPA